MPRKPLGNLLKALSRSIGRGSAKQELVWMKQSPKDIQSILRRRISGEPLQYILGMYILPMSTRN